MNNDKLKRRMTEQELKDKIVNTAISNVWKDCYGDEVVIDRAFAEQIADALIAVGLIFDVSYSFTAAFNSVQTERERDLERRLTAAEHRAEVAEKALKIATELGELCAPVEDYIKQSKRELAELKGGKE